MPDRDKDTESTASGTATNEVVQTPDQFFDGEAERPELQASPANHATKGMTTLGYTEAHRLEDTAAIQDAEREAAEKARR